jgi:hypothetical protein
MWSVADAGLRDEERMQLSRRARRPPDADKV